MCSWDCMNNDTTLLNVSVIGWTILEKQTDCVNNTCYFHTLRYSVSTSQGSLFCFFIMVYQKVSQKQFIGKKSVRQRFCFCKQSVPKLHECCHSSDEQKMLTDAEVALE